MPLFSAPNLTVVTLQYESLHQDDGRFSRFYYVADFRSMLGPAFNRDGSENPWVRSYALKVMFDNPNHLVRVR